MPQNLIYVTAENRDKALIIARLLVEERLVAGVNVLDNAISVYRWEGRVKEAGEAVLIAKTTRDNAPRVVNRVLEIHDYSCPCVVSVPLDGGNPAFLDWIDAETLKD
ncbi:dihydroorotate dehydrogenase [Alphaproteobacteria bacterium]|nr:dihydroorotate dehydrogenase [Alphaproteobacteria bacterium]